MIYPQVGPIYEISDYKEGSNTPEENMALENGYLARIKYEESQLPEGFPEHNLGVYVLSALTSTMLSVTCSKKQTRQAR